MTQKKNDAPEHDFPKGVSQPALRALLGAGYTRLEQLTTVKEADLLEIAWHGSKSDRADPQALAEQRAIIRRPGLNGGMMESKEQVFDSPQGWVRSHIQEYVESDGKKGHLWRGLPTLLLTTRGRKSGKLRRTALIYGRDGVNYLVVASNGGAAKHPAGI